MKALRAPFLVPVLVVCIIIALTVVFNMSVIDVRFEELDQTLFKVSHQQDLNKSLNMLAKYSIIKRRMEKGEESAKDYAIESKVMAVIASDFLKEPLGRTNALKYFYPVVRGGVNVFRFLMGKTVNDFKAQGKDDKELEIAYFYERNRRYDKALSIYSSILKAKKHGPQTEAYIVLHKGYCESMYGEIDKARASYEEIIRRFPDSETAMVAWKLLDFLNTLDDELKATQQQAAGTLEYAKRLFLLMDYKNAITSLTQVARATKDPAVVAEATFLKGRCHEELGETALAIENYNTVLQDHGESPFAKSANQRIFILGEFYERDKQITQLAVKRLSQYRDENFFEELSSFSGIIEESKATEEERVKQRESVKQMMTQENVDVLDLIEKIDLSGEQRAKKEAADIEKQNAAEARKAVKEVAKEVLDVNAHPLRSPSFLAREIERKCVPLRAIYNQMLKTGADFSGSVKLVFFIESSGKTKDVQISADSDISNVEFRQKVIEHVSRWQFPQIEDSYQPQKLTYPIAFKKAE